MSAVVEVSDLEKRYGETVALAGVSLTIDYGEIFCCIGPNGAGKTTLVRALTGTTTPDSGVVRIGGDSPTVIDRNRLGVLPQAFSPPDRLTVRELLTYYAQLYDESRDPWTVIDDVGLSDAKDVRYEQLSGGQQRRVCVGSALVNDPDVLVLDEPTTGIDPVGRRTVWGLIEELAATGTTVVLTTHDMAEAEHLADRVGLLADGRLVEHGTPDELVREYGGPNRLTIDLGEGMRDLDATNSSVSDDVSAPESKSRAVVSSESPSNDSVLAVIEQLDDDYGVRLADSNPRKLVVENVSPTEIGTVVDVLAGHDVDYTSLTWTEPDLETVYLDRAGVSITGDTLHTDDPMASPTVLPMEHTTASDGAEGERP